MTINEFQNLKLGDHIIYDNDETFCPECRVTWIDPSHDYITVTTTDHRQQTLGFGLGNHSIIDFKIPERDDMVCGVQTYEL
jgi:hypothetical protein